MTLQCSLIGGYNILEEYSSGLNFTLSFVKMDRFLQAPQKDRVLGKNLIDINQIFVCNANQMMWSQVDTWFTAQKLTLWEVFLHGFNPTCKHTHTQASTHTHTYIHPFLQPIQLCM
jgi:hypothetical protein